MFKIPVSTLFLGKNLVYLPECASTNSFAADLTSKGNVSDGSVVITSRQYSGRGQRGNTWETEEGANLTFSIILYPSFLTPGNQFMLAKAVSLGVVDTLTDLGIPDAMIKWPNDIMIEGRKVCGILIENQLRGNELSRSVVGVGLNVNQVAFNLPKATSITRVTGRKHDLNDILAKLLVSIERRYVQLRQDSSPISRDYFDLLYWRNELHQFEENGRLFTGKIKNVDDAGRLCVSTEDQESMFGVKEIAYIG